jgi:hypothetical protein
MNEESPVARLNASLEEVAKAAEFHFAQVNLALAGRNSLAQPNTYFYPRDDRNVLTDEHQERARDLRRELGVFGTQLLEAVKAAPILDQTDEIQLQHTLRSMSSALMLREYVHHNAYIISDEDVFHGVMPASQEERETDLQSSIAIFFKEVENIREKLDLIAPTPQTIASAIVASQQPKVGKYRPNTAFIMMQIDENNAELEDIKNTIKDVFKEFGIEAMRSDEIEHSDVATQRILDEIATCEFHIAELTGERPSVYYELGYAHALNKRPILFRKKGTRLHFDISVHNCPEYKNNTDLRDKLRKRLAAMTGKEPVVRTSQGGGS